MKKMFLFLSLIFALPAGADNYFIREPRLTGISKDEAATILELIRTAVEQNHQQIVEKEKDAKFTLRTKILKLGNAYVVTVDKFQDDKMVTDAQMKAEKFEEFDNVTSRLVRSVVTGVPLKADVRTNDVTENEAITGVRRRDTVNRWYFGMGPGQVTHVNSTRTLFNLGIGYFFEINPEWALKIIYDGTGGSDFSYLALGTNYYFSDHNTSPLVTAELGYGSASMDTSILGINSDAVSAFVVGAGAGYQFFRTSKVNLEILAHAAVLMGSNHLGTPFKYGLRVGIYW